MVKRFFKGLFIMMFISVSLYVVGYFLNEPLLMFRYEHYRGEYLIESGSSVLPLLIGSLIAAIATRK